MSVLVVGLSHSSAPLATLERAIVTGDALGKLTRDVFQAENVAGTFVISTCNRAEIYADVDKFHGGVAAICELLARHSGVPLAELTPHLYVHYEDRAVQHLLAVTCGLDSMVVGESQILGQVRQALQAAREQGTLGRTLAELGAHALHAGKRAHAETGIDRAGVSLVSVGHTMAASALAAGRPGAGRPRTGPAAADHGPAAATADHRPAADRFLAAGADSLATLSVLVVGAGSMSSLAAGTAARMGAASIVIANRSHQHAERIAATVSAVTAATSADLLRLSAEIAAADLVVSCTGAPGLVITAESVRDALKARALRRPLVLLDLALPRDIEAGVGLLPGVSVIGLEDLREAAPEGRPAAAARDEDLAEVQQIVAEEFAAHASAGRAAAVAPTVVALRAKATEVVEAELARLARRIDGMDARSQREIAQSMHRVADKLLHAPTVRVKELAGSPGADSYETALRVLFDLDPDAVLAVVRAHAELVPWPGEEAEQ